MEIEDRRRLMSSIAELFIKEAIKTESCNFTEIAERLSQPRTIRLLHAALGLSTEANEFLDALKKWIFYGKELDEVNLAEELGDGNYYEAIACDELGKSIEEIMIAVIQKLRKRYADKFSESEALTRDLSSERDELEKKIDLASGFKTQTIDKSIVVHWLKDVDSLNVLCNNMREGEKYTLDEKSLNCYKCRELLVQEFLNAKEDFGLN
jgi:NTP pyrophosphatase (non-canonical NTP hydrolase)